MRDGQGSGSRSAQTVGVGEVEAADAVECVFGVPVKLPVGRTDSSLAVGAGEPAGDSPVVG